MSFKIKKIRWSEYQIETPILLQDVNGACPLISIVNTLLMSYGLLQADVILNNASDLLETQEIRLREVTALRDRLAEKSSVDLQDIVNELIWLLVEHFNPGNDDENSKLVEMLPSLNYGLDVDPDITNGLFGNELGTRLFDIFGLKLRHGWIVDPANDNSELVELADELKTYDKIQDFLVGAAPTIATTDLTVASKAVPATAAPQTTNAISEDPVTTTAKSSSDVIEPSPSMGVTYPEPTASIHTATSIYPESTTSVNEPQTVYEPYTPGLQQFNQVTTAVHPSTQYLEHSNTIPTVTTTEPPALTLATNNIPLPGPTVSEPEPTQLVDEFIRDHESPTGKPEFSQPGPSVTQVAGGTTPNLSAPSVTANSADYKTSVLRAWLNKNSTQLTSYGLASLRDQCNPGEFLILFRNNHFNTLYKRSDQDLYLLITDSLLQRQIVWQSLNSISGRDDLFFDGDFVPFFESEELQDYLLTKNLQEQEDAKMAKELQKRYETSGRKVPNRKKNPSPVSGNNLESSTKKKQEPKKSKNNSKEDSKCIVM